MAFPEYKLLTGRDGFQIRGLPGNDPRVINNATILLNKTTHQEANRIFLDNCAYCFRAARGCTGLLTLDESLPPHANLQIDDDFKGVPCGVDKKIAAIGR